MLTKKRLASLTVFMSIAYFMLLMLLPREVVGSRADNIVLFATKIGFLGVSAAITTAILLIFIFKRDFVRWQIASFNKFKYFLWFQVKADFVKRYRKSMLGVLWSLLNPLLMMLILTMVFSFLFKNEIPNYPIYILSGRIIMSFFEESTKAAMNSVIEKEQIIKKVYVPKYTFPLAKMLSSSVNVLFSLIAFFIVFIVTRASFSWTMLLIPIPLLYAFVFSLGVGMLLASLSVFFRDLLYLYTVFLTLLTYLTPLFYPVSILPGWLQPIMGINPIYQFVEYFRKVAMYGVLPDLWTNIVCLGLALASVCCGVFVFMSQQEKYILYL